MFYKLFIFINKYDQDHTIATLYPHEKQLPSDVRFCVFTEYPMRLTTTLLQFGHIVF
jgi:hypothetical protein